MKYLLLLPALFLLISPQRSEAQDIIKSIIEDPALSLRCKSLIQDRNKHIRIKQRTQSLIYRNKKMRETMPDNKKSIMQKMEVNAKHMEHKLELTKIKIKKMEESIIRKGCPGITL